MAQMTFLQLCSRTRQECGIAGEGPTAVTAQTGIFAKIVNWVLSAHEEIQEKYPTWRFDWAQYTGVLAAQESHDPLAQFGINARRFDFDGAYCYTTAAGAASRSPLVYVPYSDFRDLRIGTTSGRPQFVTESPDKSLMFYPVPTGAETVVLDYWRKPETLAANGGIPRMPAQYHMAIVWRAVMFYCGHDESNDLFKHAKRNFDLLMDRMEDTELEPMDLAGPLA